MAKAAQPLKRLALGRRQRLQRFFPNTMKAESKKRFKIRHQPWVGSRETTPACLSGGISAVAAAVRMRSPL